MKRIRFLALGAAALVVLSAALLMLRGEGGVTAQQPDLQDRLDDVQDELARVRSEVGDVNDELQLTRSELGGVRGDISVVGDRLDRLARLLRPAAADPAAYTQAYVEEAIARYERDGREAAMAWYNSPESIDGQWYLFAYDENDIYIAHRIPSRLGKHASEIRGPDGYPIASVLVRAATDSGRWVDYLHVNSSTGNVQLKHSWLVRHDGVVFGSGWYEDGPSPTEDPAGYTQAYVDRAIQLYDALGRPAAVEYYNSEASVLGRWYLFLVDTVRDRMLTHLDPALVGRTASAINAPDGYPHGRVMSALESGSWAADLFLNSESGEPEQKHSWIVHREGLIFGSGWYEDGPSPTREPGAYSRFFVERAVQLHDALGSEAAIEFYGSMDSVVDNQYVFVIHADSGERAANPLFPDLVGKVVDESSSTDVTGRYYGDGFLTADENGRWVDYVFRNPAAGNRYAQKHTWAVRNRDLIFASGWYNADFDLRTDPPAYTKAFVQQAIDYLEREGREAAVEYYQSAESVDGAWYIFIADENGVLIVHPTQPALVGERLEDVTAPDGFESGRAIAAAASAEGAWVDYQFDNPASGEVESKHTWVRRHGGLIIGSGWYE